MKYVPMGMSGAMVSRIGFGCAAMGGYDYGPADDVESVHAVHAALEAGITLFDVADVYGFGHAEEVLGRALRAAGARDVVVATKGGVRWDDRGRTARDSSEAWLCRALDDSLRRLGVERIALYQLHWPDPHTPLEVSLAFLERCQAAGKIGHIGMCNVELPTIERAQRQVRVESLQLALSLAEPDALPALHAAAERHRMLTMTYSSLAHGLFTDRFDPGASFADTDLRGRSPLFQGSRLRDNLLTRERLRRVGARHGRPAAAVALQWVLAQPGVGVALTGIRTAAQALENAGASDWVLSPDDLLYIEGDASA